MPDKPHRQKISIDEINQAQITWLNGEIRGRCLHVGCGEKYIEGCVNIDPNPDRPRVDYRYDVHHMGEFLDGSFDSIISSHVIPSLKDPLAAFREMARVLCVGGMMAHVIPDNTFAQERKNARFPFQYQHYNWYSPQAFKQQIMDPLADILFCETCRHFPNFTFSFQVRAIKL